MIADWQHEFTTEVIHRSGHEYIAHLQALGVFDTVRQNIDSPDYLSMHMALQYILRSRGGYRLSLARAEDGPFRLHVLGRWGRTPLKLRLLFSKITHELPPLIKGYLRAGAFICGEPAWDPDFRCADFFVLLPLAATDARYARRFVAPAGQPRA